MLVMAAVPFQGPGPPWCIGSVFGTPRLRATSDLGPLLFDSVGEAQQFLSTGCRLHLFDDPIVPTEKQSHYIVEDPSIAFTPDSLVQELGQEDMAKKIAMIQASNTMFGNRLECFKCSDGKLQLMFPIGENFNCIGSILCERDSAGWCPLKKEEGEPDIDWLDSVRMAVSPSVNHPIRQLSAMKVIDSAIDESILIARTQYQVHVANVLREGDRVCFGSRSVRTYRKGVSHVVWSPHVEGELATILENGEVHLYDVQSSQDCTYNLRERVILKARMIEASAGNEAESLKFPKAVTFEMDNLKKHWWRVEYGWHPKMLLIANAESIVLSDLRERFRDGDTTVLASIESSKNYCHKQRCKDDRFVSLVRSNENAYHFAAATLEHVMLFDVRRPRMPLLQWEHNMQDDFPGNLSIYPLSMLRPNADSGRVIFASSFRSGDIRAFCYGPQRHDAEIIAGASTRFRDIEDCYCAWHLPSRVSTTRPQKACLTVVSDYITKKIPDNFLENLSGLALLCDQGGKSFSLVQLTGSGDILNQSYITSKASTKKEDSTKAPGYPSRVIAKNGKKKDVMKRKDLPFLLNYVRHGKACLAESECAKKIKRLKTSHPDNVEVYKDNIYKVLADTDIFLSNYEISLRVLHSGLPESLAELAAKMPSNVAGLAKSTSRMPYVLPPVKFLQVTQSPTSVPLPLVMEIGPTVKNQSFQNACEAVEAVTSLLNKQQEEPVISLVQSDDDTYNLSQELCFISRNSTDGASSSTSTARTLKFQNFVGSRKLVEETPMEFGSGDSALGPLARLQQDFAKWQQSFTPYATYRQKHL